MKIKEIIIEGLYKKFSHHIKLNREDGITIIHAPNGFGKTVILKMLDGLINFRLSVFQNIPFNNFKVIFDDDSYVEVIQAKTSPSRDENKRKYSINIYHKKGNENLSEPFSGYIKSDYSESLSELLKRRSEWFDVVITDVHRAQEAFERSSHALAEENLPEWYKTIRNLIQVYFIQTQRLLLESPERKDIRLSPFTDTISQHSRELTQIIAEKLAEFASISQTLDRTFPKRLVENQFNPKEFSIDQLKNKLSQLEQKRIELKAVGLIEKTEDADFQIPATLNEHSLPALSIYIKDVEQKLSVFDELAQRIKLFTTILNNRFLYKTISISKEKGFILLTDEGEELSGSDLSSGEQHELILLYEMLFKVESNSLNLIDEPEISLHIVWQEQFLSDLEKIIALRGFDVLIATHSPQIINDRWDLTVELKGTGHEAAH